MSLALGPEPKFGLKPAAFNMRMSMASGNFFDSGLSISGSDPRKDILRSSLSELMARERSFVNCL